MWSGYLDALSDPVLLADDDRRAVDVNVAMCDLFGRTRGELLSRRLDDLTGASLDAFWAELRATGQARRDVVIHPSAGTQVPVAIHAHARLAPGDHAALVRLERPDARLPARVLGELVSLHEYVMTGEMTADEAMRAICERATAMTAAEGATVELEEAGEMVYRVATGSIAQFAGFRLPSAGSMSGLAARSGEVLRCDDSELDPRVDRAACGRVGVRSMIVAPLQSGAGLVGVLKVVSTRPHAFDAASVSLLQLVAGFLGTAIATVQAHELRRTLAQREAARLAELERLRDEMTALVVHDLKSPVSVIMANLQYVREALPTSSADALAAAVDALEATARLDTLIRTLLDTAKLEQGHLVADRRPIDARRLAADVLTPRAALARARGIALVNDVPAIEVETDGALLHRVFENIVDNAFRFVPAGGRVELVAERRDARIRWRLGNDGPPISPATRERIFDKFAGMSADSRRNFGLGLYFCRLAVEALAGTIRVEQTERLPATFVIDLPA